MPRDYLEEILNANVYEVAIESPLDAASSLSERLHNRALLVGIQVPRGDKRAFQEFLRRLGYEHVDETQNPAYELFLR